MRGKGTFEPPIPDITVGITSYPLCDLLRAPRSGRGNGPGRHCPEIVSGSLGGRIVVMSVTLDLPEDVVRRLTAEAQRRGTRLADVIIDLAARLPSGEAPPGRRLAFVGAGASGVGITPRMDDLLADGFGRD